MRIIDWSYDLCSSYLKDTVTGDVSPLDVEGGFVAIGHHPATALFRGHLDLDSDSYIKVEPGSTRTSIPGVFACGDVMDNIYRHAVTADGPGFIAARDAEKFLAEADFGRNAKRNRVVKGKEGSVR